MCTNRKIVFENLEARRVLFAGLPLASDFGPQPVEPVESEPWSVECDAHDDHDEHSHEEHDHEEHDHDEHDHDEHHPCDLDQDGSHSAVDHLHGIMLSADELASSGTSGSGWDAGIPQPITHEVVVQPIIVSNDDGTNTAGYFGTEANQASIESLIDEVWSQAGIDVDWLEPNYWNNTFANVGNGGTRPTSDLGRIIDAGDSAGVGSTDPHVLDMYFVETSAGFGTLSENHANGLAFLGGNGITVHIGDNLVGWSGGQEVAARVVAHEIGHNLGLAHVIDTVNLMDDGERLNETQIETSLASAYSEERMPVTPIEFLAPGQEVFSPNAEYKLVMQRDGNLTIWSFETGNLVWHTQTWGHTDTFSGAVMQPDGNFVLFAGATPLFHTWTFGNSGATLGLDNSGTLNLQSQTGELLWTSAVQVSWLDPGSFARTPDGRYALVMQTDGNLVLFRWDVGAVWSTGTSGSVTAAVMQTDGNFVVWSGPTALFSTGTYGNHDSRLVLDGQGLRVVSRLGRVLWHAI